MAVVVETTIGDFTVDLFIKERPQTCRNFLKLCKIKYYNWSLFFTVQSNFIAQTGDPTATGKGGESVYGIVLGDKARYYEAEKFPKMKHDKVGLLSMVNCGNNMLGSQFFITLGSNLQSLDGEHCVFGEITEGLDIILKFNEVICDVQHRPYQDVRISHTVILEDPYDDMVGLVIPDKSPERTKEFLTSERIGADEAIDDTAGLSMEEITEMQKEKEAKARETILEIIGDIPEVGMAPPENVLFVCKLNPATNDDDLEIIFSRFGKIIGCEIIRDKQSGDSLQYAFIEYADRKSCENAYFSMDNVLIDDRRIHVDFSQSVAKMRWYGKGKGIFYKDDQNNKRKNKIEKRRSRSFSPKNNRRAHEADRYDFIKNDREKFRNYHDKKQTNDSRDKKHKSRSRSRSRNRQRRRSVSKNRDRKRRSESKERRYRSRSTERRERSKDRKEKKRSNADYDQNFKIKDTRRKCKNYESDSSEERTQKHSRSKKSRKSREKSAEKHNRSDYKHKHKHKSR